MLTRFPRPHPPPKYLNFNEVDSFNLAAGKVAIEKELMDSARQSL